MDRNALVSRINRTLDLPLAVLSLVMLGLVLADLSFELTAAQALWLDRANWAIWSVFALEFVLKLGLSTNKRHYLKTHWFDALVVIVPMFRVLRALRALRVAKAFPLFRLVAFAGVSLRGVGHFFRRHRLGYLGALTGIVIVVTAVAEYLLERQMPGTGFRTFGDALYWSAALMTTVGAGWDPQTPLGRVIAVAVMMYSVSVFAFLVSALASDLFARGPSPAPAPTAEEGAQEMDGAEPEAPRQADASIPPPPRRPG